MSDYPMGPDGPEYILADGMTAHDGKSVPLAAGAFVEVQTANLHFGHPVPEPVSFFADRATRGGNQWLWSKCKHPDARIVGYREVAPPIAAFDRSKFENRWSEA